VTVIATLHIVPMFSLATRASKGVGLFDSPRSKCASDESTPYISHRGLRVGGAENAGPENAARENASSKQLEVQTSKAFYATFKVIPGTIIS